MNRQAFTLFELLAVLTIIGIGLVVVVGSYGSWGTAHALTGTTRVVEAGLQQARTIAMTQSKYVGFLYESSATNHFQIYLCTNENAEVAATLGQQYSGQTMTESKIAALLQKLGQTPAAPDQRLTGHIRLAYLTEPTSTTTEETGILFFCPDGRVFGNPAETSAHYIGVYTRSLFNQQPLCRLIRVDLATGLVAVIQPEPKETP